MCVVTFIHLCNTVRKSGALLTILSSPLTHLFLSPSTADYCPFFLSSRFRLLQNVVKLDSCSLLSCRTGFFHLATCGSGGSRSLHGLIVYFWLVLNNVPLPGRTTVGLFIHHAEGPLGYFPVLVILEKAATNIPVPVFVWTQAFVILFLNNSLIEI